MAYNKGHCAERIACQWLKQQSIKIITTNYFSRLGEIDIIAIDRDKTLCFIEVRYRLSPAYGSAIESVNHTKQAKIIKTAKHYLLENPGQQNRPSRFDIIAITGNMNNPVIDWLKNAFMMDT